MAPPTHKSKHCHWCRGEVEPIRGWEELMEWREPEGECVREGVRVPLTHPTTPSTHPKTLVCHDMKGGYLDDRFVDGCDNKDAYRFYHWSGVDIFVYFSHHLVTIPPPGWLNAAHTHGVTVLGTFITEWEGGSGVCEKLLEDETTVEEGVRQLTRIARHHGFEGWLINVENELPKEKIPLMLKFVKDLTKAMREGSNEKVTTTTTTKTNKEKQVGEMGEREEEKMNKHEEHIDITTQNIEHNTKAITTTTKTNKEKQVGEMEGREMDSVTHRVIWYDSVTVEGKLDWQNELNQHNDTFFSACDGIFLNYTWSEEHLERTRRAAAGRTNDVFVGVDVFGRNFYAGGKFNTWKALEVIRKFGLSAAIFAPGWTYETQEDFTEAERQLWWSLSPYLTHRGFERLPFNTSFCQGYGDCVYANGKVEREGAWHNLNKQQPQPIWSQEVSSGKRCMSLVTDEAYNGGGCLEVTTHTPTTLRLFLCNVEWRGGIRLSVAYKWCSKMTFLSILCHLSRKNSTKNKILDFTCDKEEEEKEEEEEEEIIKCPIEDIRIENGWCVRTFLANEVPQYTMNTVSMSVGGNNARLRIGHISIINTTS